MRDPIGHASCRVAFDSGLYADRAHTRVVSAFDVNLLVANEKRARKVNSIISGCFYDHSWRGLATGRMLPRSIRTEISRVDQAFAKLARYLRFYRAILIEREQSATDATLICDDNEFKTSRLQSPQCV